MNTLLLLIGLSLYKICSNDFIALNTSLAIQSKSKALRAKSVSWAIVQYPVTEL